MRSLLWVTLLLLSALALAHALECDKATTCAACLETSIDPSSQQCYFNPISRTCISSQQYNSGNYFLAAWKLLDDENSCDKLSIKKRVEDFQSSVTSLAHSSHLNTHQPSPANDLVVQPTDPALNSMGGTAGLNTQTESDVGDLNNQNAHGAPQPNNIPPTLVNDNVAGPLSPDMGGRNAERGTGGQTHTDDSISLSSSKRRLEVLRQHVQTKRAVDALGPQSETPVPLHQHNGQEQPSPVNELVAEPLNPKTLENLGDLEHEGYQNPMTHLHLNQDHESTHISLDDPILKPLQGEKKKKKGWGLPNLNPLTIWKKHKQEKKEKKEKKKDNNE